MNTTLFIQPSDSYRYFKSKIPDILSSKHLVVIHYISDYVCSRWTSRKRDIIRTNAKKLNYDCCVGYLLDIDSIEALFNSKANICILAYRFYEDKWVSRVEFIDFNLISWIEFYDKGGSIG